MSKRNLVGLLLLVIASLIITILFISILGIIDTTKLYIIAAVFSFIVIKGLDLFLEEPK